MNRWQLPRIDAADRWIGGVAAAIARELGVDPLVVRVSFAVLILAGGWGLAFYALAWVVLAVAHPRQLAPYTPQPKAASTFYRHIAVAMVVLGLLMALRNTAFFIDRIVFPVAFVVTGFLVAWTRHVNEDGLAMVVRILAGVAIGVGGMVAFLTLASTGVAESLFILVIAITIVGGIGLVAAPSLARIGHDLDDERQNRVRADERARVAAHLHDSVLQTLALIQRHADDPVRTAQLARRQERELRTWLYASDDETKPGTVRLGAILEEMAAAVDASHGVPVKVIAVGKNTAEVPEGLIDPLVAATREAVVNAAKHSEAKRVDVFAERHDDRIEIFVRDTGVGFDPSATASDRRGVAESIIGRMERVGGTAQVNSEPGTGTEVELVLPLTDPSPDKKNNRTSESSTSEHPTSERQEPLT